MIISELRKTLSALYEIFLRWINCIRRFSRVDRATDSNSFRHFEQDPEVGAKTMTRPGKFGRRYLSHSEFFDYAKSLDVFADFTANGILEFLERRAIINPVARVRFPAAIARRWHKERHPSEIIPEPIEGDTDLFKAACNLREQIYSGLWRKAAVFEQQQHPLDDLSAVHAPFVTTDFSPSNFVPWSNFRAVIATSNGKDVGDGGESTRTFYHYWHVFPLAAFSRSGMTVLYDHKDEALSGALWELRIPPDAREGILASINIEGRHELARVLRQASLFDTVAWFEDYRHIALQKYYNEVDRETGELPHHLSQEYDDRCREIAHEATTRASITPDQILEFIKFQCDLWREARRRGPAKIAEEYQRNILSTVDMHHFLTGSTFEEVTTRVGRVGGSLKPILNVIFPDWLDDQRALAEASLANWVVPLTAALAAPYVVSRDDVSAFCGWLESRELYQMYWHFKRLLDTRFEGSTVAQVAVASEVVNFANTIELLANAILEARGQTARGLTLMPKVYGILGQRAPHLVLLLKQHKQLTNTASSTLSQRMHDIDAVNDGGPDAPVVRALLKLVVIRNEGSHLGFAGLGKKTVFAILSALSLASLLIWKMR